MDDPLSSPIGRWLNHQAMRSLPGRTRLMSLSWLLGIHLGTYSASFKLRDMSILMLVAGRRRTQTLSYVHGNSKYLSEAYRMHR